MPVSFKARPSPCAWIAFILIHWASQKVISARPCVLDPSSSRSRPVERPSSLARRSQSLPASFSSPNYTQYTTPSSLIHCPAAPVAHFNAANSVPTSLAQTRSDPGRGAGHSMLAESSPVASRLERARSSPTCAVFRRVTDPSETLSLSSLLDTHLPRDCPVLTQSSLFRHCLPTPPSNRMTEAPGYSCVRHNAVPPAGRPHPRACRPRPNTPQSTQATARVIPRAVRETATLLRPQFQSVFSCIALSRNPHVNPVPHTTASHCAEPARTALWSCLLRLLPSKCPTSQARVRTDKQTVAGDVSK